MVEDRMKGHRERASEGPRAVVLLFVVVCLSAFDSKPFILTISASNDIVWYVHARRLLLSFVFSMVRPVCLFVCVCASCFLPPLLYVEGILVRPIPIRGCVCVCVPMNR